MSRERLTVDEADEIWGTEVILAEEVILAAEFALSEHFGFLILGADAEISQM